jgi:hypothetical protein
MNNPRYVFTDKKSDEFKYNPVPAIHKFYQICYLKNPQSKKHIVRVSEVDEQGNFVKIEERRYNDLQMAKFFRTHRPNCYKLYATYDLTLVDYPNSGSVLESQSPLLNQDNDMSGYAKF